MYIETLINKRLFEEGFQLFDPKGSAVEVQKFQEDYTKLRNYFSQLPPNTGVGIQLPKDHRYLMSILASMEAGTFHVPMSMTYPAQRIKQIQEETDYELHLDTRVLEKILAEEKKEFLKTKKNPDATLYKICTSGSTGRPKAVVVGRSAIEHFWKWVESKFNNVTKDDSTLQVTEFTFDISLIDVGLFLSRGCSLYFSEFKGNIFSLAYEIEQYKITTLNTVVNNVNMLLDDKVVSRANYSSLHTVMMGGARFSYGLYQRCQTHFSHLGVHNLYGVTEVPVYSHCKTMDFTKNDLHEVTVSVGQPLGGCTAIIAKNGVEQSIGEKGEVLMGGLSLMKEYAKNPEKTTEVFTVIEGKKYYRSGDIGFRKENGDFFVTGRLDDTIKYRGYRINLLDIDSYILMRPYIQDSVTIAIEDEETQNKTICFAITKESIDEKQMKKDLSNVLLEYQIPERIHFVSSYPINANGKVCKKTLKKNYIEGKTYE